MEMKMKLHLNYGTNEKNEKPQRCLKLKNFTLKPDSNM